MSILDRLALVVAERHSERACATVAVDALHFLAPAFLGEVLIFKASLNRAWNTSMEVGLKVMAENVVTRERRHVISAYFTFVALDENHKPAPIPAAIPETPLEKRRFEEADIRKKNRIAHSEAKKEWRADA